MFEDDQPDRLDPPVESVTFVYCIQTVGDIAKLLSRPGIAPSI